MPKHPLNFEVVAKTPPQLLLQPICSLNSTQLPNRAICQFTVKPMLVNHVTSTCKENLPNLLSKRERKTRSIGSGVHWKGERISQLSGGITRVRSPVAVIGRNGNQSNDVVQQRRGRLLCCARGRGESLEAQAHEEAADLRSICVWVSL